MLYYALRSRLFWEGCLEFLRIKAPNSQHSRTPQCPTAVGPRFTSVENVWNRGRSAGARGADPRRSGKASLRSHAPGWQYFRQGSHELLCEPWRKLLMKGLHRGYMESLLRATRLYIRSIDHGSYKYARVPFNSSVMEDLRPWGSVEY